MTGRVAILLFSLALPAASAASAQSLNPLERLESLHLSQARVGRVAVFFAPGDSARAHELAGLTDRAASFLSRELGVDGPLRLAVLAPDDWFSEFPAIPYAIPWDSKPHRLIFMPASLSEGLLIRGENELEDRRRVDFVLLHEIGHIVAKDYFSPTGSRDYLPVSWFEELLATYVGYAYLHAHDPTWAAASRDDWQRVVDGFTPRQVSLDWTFMLDLPPEELARTYGWYQNLLNLRVAELHDEHGLDLLRRLRRELPWAESEQWTTESVLPLVERAAPGFRAWADALPTRFRSRE